MANFLRFIDNDTSQDGLYMSPDYIQGAPPVSVGPGQMGGQGSGLGTTIGPAQDYSGAIGAGIGAAGQTASVIAQIAAQNAARQRAMEQSQLGNAHTEKIAKMQIEANAASADKQRRLQAQEMLLQALSGAASNSLGAYDNKRNANKMGSSLIAQAYARY